MQVEVARHLAHRHALLQDEPHRFLFELFRKPPSRCHRAPPFPKNTLGWCLRKPGQLTFLSFCEELGRRDGVSADGYPIEDTALGSYLEAIATSYDTSGTQSMRRRSFRALAPVRMVNGDTKQEVRGRLMHAFNSPMFPEVLISSSVLAEGVDLHRFWRTVVHHDLTWNPSTLEQRTGRVDRLRSLAERTGALIEVYEPYISGSADERMFRVVKDRERWFKVVMGQGYLVNEQEAESMTERVPLPMSLAERLVFRLEASDEFAG